MKQVKIYLRQGDIGQFEVVRFSNTVQLSVGMLVPHATVENWCAMPRVQVEILGLVEEKESEETPLLTEAPAKPVRYDATREFDPESQQTEAKQILGAKFSNDPVPF